MTLRLPFVARATYDRAVASSIANGVEIAGLERSLRVLRRANDRLRGERDEARTRYAELLRLYHELRTMGANATPGRMAPAAPPTSPADAAIEAKLEQWPAPLRPALRRRLQKYVLSERMKPNAVEDRIAARVSNWADQDTEESA